MENRKIDVEPGLDQNRPAGHVSSQVPGLVVLLHPLLIQTVTSFIIAMGLSVPLGLWFCPNQSQQQNVLKQKTSKIIQVMCRSGVS